MLQRGGGEALPTVAAEPASVWIATMGIQAAPASDAREASTTSVVRSVSVAILARSTPLFRHEERARLDAGLGEGLEPDRDVARVLQARVVVGAAAEHEVEVDGSGGEQLAQVESWVLGAGGVGGVFSEGAPSWA